MKKLILILCLISTVCFSQEKPKQQPNFKNIKIGLLSAGAFTVAGAVTTVIKTYQPASKQKDFARVSSMFYGFAGVSLVTIVFNF